MSYRDDDAALRTYHDDLARELTRLEARLADLHDVEGERSRVAAELARVRADLAQQTMRQGPVRLAQLRVQSPCKQSWRDMIGDERVRVCAGCERPVFNLSGMTTAEAEAVLATRGVTPCVRFFQRKDGTVMTTDCPTGVRRRTWTAVAVATLLTAGAGATAYAASGPEKPEHEVMMGVIAEMPPIEVMGDIEPDPPPVGTGDHASIVLDPPAPVTAVPAVPVATPRSR